MLKISVCIEDFPLKDTTTLALATRKKNECPRNCIKVYESVSQIGDTASSLESIGSRTGSGDTLNWIPFDHRQAPRQRLIEEVNLHLIQRRISPSTGTISQNKRVQVSQSVGVAFQCYTLVGILYNRAVSQRSLCSRIIA